MNHKQFYSADQLQVLIGAHKILCAQRGINPMGEAGKDLAARLLDRFSGEESQADLVRQFAH